MPDCTERTNLRKWGTGDMFFTYVTRVCLDLKREMVGGMSQVSSSYSYHMTEEQRNMAAAAAAAKARELHLSGMSMSGGVGRESAKQLSEFLRRKAMDGQEGRPAFRAGRPFVCLGVSGAFSPRCTWPCPCYCAPAFPTLFQGLTP